MKKHIFLILVSVLWCELSFAQVSASQPMMEWGNVEEQLTDKSDGKSMGFWVLPYTGATSPWRIPGNNWRYQRAQYLVRAREITSSGFPTGSTIDAIGFYIITQGVGAQTGSLKIYMKSTADTTYNLGSTWTTAGFTLVCDIASWTVPIDIGPYVIEFSGGSPFTYTGEGVYVAYEFSNPSGTIGTTALSARCNDVLPFSFRGDRNNTALPTSLISSSFRPQTQFINNSLVDIAHITNIYTLEKVAAGYSNTPIDVRVVNVSAEPATFDVIVTVKDLTQATTYYTESKTVTNLAAGAAALVNFSGWSPTVMEDVFVIAETSAIPNENWLINNTLSIKSNVNSSILSYAFSNSNPSSFGYTYPNTGIFASKFRMNESGSVSGANVVLSNSTTSVGRTIYAVVMNSSGNILKQSANYVVQAGDPGTTKSLTFPSPATFTNEDFYIGLAQTTGTGQWYPLGIFTENPQRENTFYTAGISGGTLTIVPATYRLKFGIEAIVTSAPVSVQDHQMESFAVYPNPTNGAISFKINIAEASQHMWNLYNSNGKWIKGGTERLSAGEHIIRLDAGNLPSGLYILKSNVDGSIKSFKITIM